MIHDSFCRCRTCKPPLVGDATRAVRFYEIAAVFAIGGVLLAATAATAARVVAGFLS